MSSQAMSSQAMSSQAMSSQAMSSHAMPSQMMSSQAMPSQIMSSQIMSSQAMPSQAIPPQGIGSQFLPSQSVAPPQAMMTHTSATCIISTGSDGPGSSMSRTESDSFYQSVPVCNSGSLVPTTQASLHLSAHPQSQINVSISPGVAQPLHQPSPSQHNNTDAMDTASWGGASTSQHVYSAMPSVVPNNTFTNAPSSVPTSMLVSSNVPSLGTMTNQNVPAAAYGYNQTLQQSQQLNTHTIPFVPSMGSCYPMHPEPMPANSTQMAETRAGGVEGASSSLEGSCNPSTLQDSARIAVQAGIVGSSKMSTASGGGVGITTDVGVQQPTPEQQEHIKRLLQETSHYVKDDPIRLRSEVSSLPPPFGGDERLQSGTDDTAVTSSVQLPLEQQRNPPPVIDMKTQASTLLIPSQQARSTLPIGQNYSSVDIHQLSHQCPSAANTAAALAQTSSLPQSLPQSVLHDLAQQSTNQLIPHSLPHAIPQSSCPQIPQSMPHLIAQITVPAVSPLVPMSISAQVAATSHPTSLTHQAMPQQQLPQALSQQQVSQSMSHPVCPSTIPLPLAGLNAHSFVGVGLPSQQTCSVSTHISQLQPTHIVGQTSQSQVVPPLPTVLHSEQYPDHMICTPPCLLSQQGALSDRAAAVTTVDTAAITQSKDVTPLAANIDVVAIEDTIACSSATRHISEGQNMIGQTCEPVLVSVLPSSVPSVAPILQQHLPPADPPLHSVGLTTYSTSSANAPSESSQVLFSFICFLRLPVFVLFLLTPFRIF